MERRRPRPTPNGGRPSSSRGAQQQQNRLLLIRKQHRRVTSDTASTISDLTGLSSSEEDFSGSHDFASSRIPLRQRGNKAPAVAIKRPSSAPSSPHHRPDMPLSRPLYRPQCDISRNQAPFHQNEKVPLKVRSSLLLPGSKRDVQTSRHHSGKDIASMDDKLHRLRLSSVIVSSNPTDIDSLEEVARNSSGKTTTRTASSGGNMPRPVNVKRYPTVEEYRHEGNDLVWMPHRSSPSRSCADSENNSIAACSQASRPVSVDECGPIDVDTGETVWDVAEEGSETDDGDDDSVSCNVFPVLDETEMSVGLVGYVDGFEPVVEDVALPSSRTVLIRRRPVEERSRSSRTSSRSGSSSQSRTKFEI